jgi:hypothetical protein
LPAPSQSVPARVHSTGGVAQVPQVTDPALPVQGCAQPTGAAATRHLSPSSVQVTIALPVPSQNVPGWPVVQAEGGVGQTQTALGNLPPQGSALGQPTVAAA